MERKLRKERENFASNNSFVENSLNITDDNKEEEIKSQYYDILQKYGKKRK